MGGTFGLGTPFTHPVQQVPWGSPPYGAQGLSINPFALQGQPFTNLLSSAPIGNVYGYGAQPLQQVLQLLQLVPQQLEQLQFQQMQQLQQIHQLVQLIPAQLGQLQQLIQLGLRQQQSQLQQPFGQAPGLGNYALASPWGISPPIVGAQPGHVM